MKKDNKTIELVDLKGAAKHARIYIEGDSDLVLNKMNARNTRALLVEDRKSKLREQANVWEDVITSVHWRDPVDLENSYTKCDEAMMLKLLKENAPCITTFGLKKSFGQSVVRNGIDTYATKFDASLNVQGNMGLIPIKFTQWGIDERLMSPQKGSPVTVYLNHFSGWSASFVIDYFEHVYSINEIVNIINLAGFGIGIGSGRSSGYGRYHVVNVEG